MLVFGTQMHVVTFVFVLLESVMFFYQLLYFLFRPQDRSRLWYLILLFLLIVYNITGGLFPDPKIPISIISQNIIAYGSGFLMASYFPYYFYRGFELTRIRFHAHYGVLLFLLLPYFIFFVIDYSLHGNLDSAIKNGVVVPFFYAFVVLWAIIRAILLKYRERPNQNNLVEIVAVYCAIIPWSSLAVLSYLRVSQLVEVVVTNGGFLVITVLFISRYITEARIEYEQLVKYQTSRIRNLTGEPNYKAYRLTNREIEIVNLIRQGIPYRAIGDQLFISPKTVAKHVQHIFEKTQVTNKVELIHKLERTPIEDGMQMQFQ